MTKFRFQGTGETYGSSVPAGLVLGLLAAAAVIAWLLTILWVLALITAVVLGLIVLAVIWLRRAGSGDQGAQRLAQQAAGLRAEIGAREKPQITSPQPPMIVNNFNGGSHLHVSPARDTGVIRTALPDRDAIIRED